MSKLKDEYMDQIEDFYQTRIEPQQINVDIPSYEGDSKNDEPYFGDNEPAF